MSSSSKPRSPLGPHLFEILLVLADGPAHGYGIVSEIRERTEGQVVLATSTLYRGIDRLLSRGLIAEEKWTHEEPSGGPPRRYYRITESGRALAEAEAERLRDVMARAAARFLEPDSRT